MFTLNIKPMSTRSTLVHGPNFHLYHDLLDQDHVHLEIEGTRFEAEYGRVMVPIPVHVWEVIRHYPGVDLQLADKTDDELRQHVEWALDERLAWYRQIKGKAKRVAALAGSLTWGTADQPRGVQLARGLEHYTQLREHQRQIQQAIAKLERVNTRGITAGSVEDSSPKPLADKRNTRPGARPRKTRA